MKDLKYRKISSLDFRYEISRNGEVRNIKSKKVLFPRKNAGGYNQVNCQVNKTNPRYKSYGYVTCQIHQLVMEAWGPQKPSEDKTPAGLPVWVVDHKDKNKLNNDITNLRWLSWSDNSKNTDRTYDYLTKKANHHKFCFEVTEKGTDNKVSFDRASEVEAFIRSRIPTISQTALKNGIYRGYSHGFCIKKISLKCLETIPKGSRGAIDTHLEIGDTANAVKI